jgi:hypothetical protein
VPCRGDSDPHTMDWSTVNLTMLFRLHRFYNVECGGMMIINGTHKDLWRGNRGLFQCTTRAHARKGTFQSE